MASTSEGDFSHAPWLMCHAGSHLCAVPIAQVSETMRALPIEAVAGAPPGVLGVAVIRGAPVPVVDLGYVLGGTASQFKFFITIKADARTIALAVDAVVGIRLIGAQTYKALPPLLRDAANETITGIAARDAALTLLLSASRIVSPEVLAHLESEKAA